tara:strand:+ start:91 stop:381 length:291 start_codon:yes stop_codon:yes gene_type:complete
MIIPSRMDAVRALVDGTFTFRSDGIIVYHDGQTAPSESAITAKLAELVAAYDAQAYARSRQAEYPSIEDCIHAILDNELEALQVKRQAVKTKYPKP